jgi:hypothetical protein
MDPQSSNNNKVNDNESVWWDIHYDASLHTRYDARLHTRYDASLHTRYDARLHTRYDASLLSIVYL